MSDPILRAAVNEFVKRMQNELVRLHNATEDSDIESQHAAIAEITVLVGMLKSTSSN